MRTYKHETRLAAGLALAVFFLCGCVLSSDEPTERVYINGRWADVAKDARLGNAQAFAESAARRVREPVWIEWMPPETQEPHGHLYVECGLLVDFFDGVVYIAQRQNVETDSCTIITPVPLDWIKRAWYLEPGDSIPGVPRKR